jgi:hypothetical protein
MIPSLPIKKRVKQGNSVIALLNRSTNGS